MKSSSTSLSTAIFTYIHTWHLHRLAFTQNWPLHRTAHTAFPTMDSDFLILQVELFRVRCFHAIHLTRLHLLPLFGFSSSYSSSICRFPWENPHRGDHPFGIPPGSESPLQVAVRTMPNLRASSAPTCTFTGNPVIILHPGHPAWLHATNQTIHFHYASGLHMIR